MDLLEKVRHLRVKDNEMVKIVEEIKQIGVKMLRNRK